MFSVTLRLQRWLTKQSKNPGGFNHNKNDFSLDQILFPVPPNPDPEPKHVY